MLANVLTDGFRLPEGAQPVACVDIGGTKVAVNIVDAQGARGKVVEPTATTGANDALASQIIRMVGQSCAAAGVAVDAVARVGVSSCGPFVLNDGLVELAAPNICGGMAGKARGLPNEWQTALLEGPLRHAFAHVRVENDGIGALEAERGNIGDVEALIAGNAIARRFAPLGYSDAAALFAAAYAGDTRAVALVDELCLVMGRMLFGLIATLDLRRISIGGSVYWHHRAYLLPRLQAYVRGKLPALTDGCELVSAGLGERVGDFGALALVV